MADSDAPPGGLADTVRRPPSAGDGSPSRLLTSFDGFHRDEEELPSVQPEHYELGREFARGGLGRILVAKDRRLRRRVAVKELLSQHPRAVERFTREAFITARLEHPNIVPIHEGGQWPDGRRFYVMKLVEGRTLADALDTAVRRKDRLDLLPHVIDVAEAVAYAHSQGILHRDLKPGNVMVGAFGETVVIDWGLAKDMWTDGAEPVSVGQAEEPAATMTSDGTVVGTPPYMAPEQARAGPVDERSDVYALGAMLYHVLSGRHPYQDVRSKDVLTAVVSGPPRSLRDLAPDCPLELIAIAEKAMARDPRDRYPSAREMARELRRFTTGQIVRAHAYSTWDHFVRFVRRHRAAVAVSAVAATSFAAFGAWSFDQIRAKAELAERQRIQAEAQRDQAVIDNARYLLDVDPTASMRKLLDLGEPSRPESASVAAEAEELGVARFVDASASGAEIDAVAISADGSLAASGSRNGEVRLLDTETGGVRVLEGHSDRITQLRFFGHQLVSASYDDSLRVWDTRTAGSVRLGGHTGDVKGFARVGQHLASIADDGTLRTWTMEGEPAEVIEVGRLNRGAQIVAARDGTLAWGGLGRDVWVMRSGRTRRLTCDATEATALALSSDGRRLACGGESGRVELYTLGEDGDARRTLTSSGPGTLALEFGASAGDVLVSAHFDGSVVAHDVPTGASRLLATHDERVTSVAYDPERERWATAGWDRTIWLRHRLEPDALRLKGHAGTVSSIAFDENGRWMVSGAWDGQMRVWALRGPVVRLLAGHRVGVHGVDVSPDGTLVASGGHDDDVRIWDLETGASRVLKGHTDHVYRVRFSPDGRWLASSSDDRTVRLWDPRDDAHQVLRGHTADVEEIQFSADGAFLASAGEDNAAWLWRVGADTVGRPLLGHEDVVTDVAFSADGSFVFTSGRDGALWRWTTEDGAGRKLFDLDEPVWSLALNGRGDTLIVASEGEVRLVDVRTLDVEVLGSFPGAYRVEASPDGSFLAIAGRGGVWLCVLSVRDCRLLGAPRGQIEAMVFGPEGRYLATAGEREGIRLWDTQTREYRPLFGHSLTVYDLAFGGGRLVSGSADADVRVWNVRGPPRPSRLTAWISNVVPTP